MTAARPLRVCFACTGLGRERRGFETFTRDCAQALAGAPDVALEVFAGGRDGHVPGEVVVPNLPRASRAARALGTLLRRDPYFIEQGTFFLGFLPRLLARAPDLIYFADLNFGNALWHWRRRVGGRWRLLFYNGGNTTRPFTRCDHVQLLTPAAGAAALARGEPPARLTVLPHGLSLPPTFVPTDAAARRAARAALGLPPTGEILLSVGQLDRATKRTHLLIEAVAALPAPRPYLLLIGAGGPDAEELRALAAARLGAAWSWRSEPRERMSVVYAAADRSALLSHGEGFGLAYAESLAAGLPLLVHDDPTTRHVVGDAGLRVPIGGVEDARRGLVALLEARTDATAAEARHAWVRGRFGWAVLRAEYLAMFQRAAAAPIEALT
ncbi:MAG: glycosyltransferase family 4 protein [Gemmatimonadaceae bacterium]|nr:glycosyltransferase family 4 protein [Gemmatimonadaceae bacterium]